MKEKETKVNWGQMQRKCHRWFDELFDSKKDGYKWLKDNFGINHFSSLNHKTDENLLRDIYQALYIKSIIE